MNLLLASGNAKKASELLAMLEPFGLGVLRPEDVGGLPDVDEDQPTFEGNAAKKARSAAAASGQIALADDSGLCVDALDGAPGIFSARYAGQHGDDEGNNQKLLRAMAQVPEEQRGAHFVCCLCVAKPDGTVLFQTRGEVHGRILHESRGSHGFGYDPLFQIDEPDHPHRGRAMAELQAHEKATISHRGRALQALSQAIAQASPDPFR